MLIQWRTRGAEDKGPGELVSVNNLHQILEMRYVPGEWTGGSGGMKKWDMPCRFGVKVSAVVEACGATIVR